MKNRRMKHTARWGRLMPLIALMALYTSCREDYYLDEQEPTWLGESIYDYLVEEGDYTYYVRLIDSLGQTPVLSKTGSKTLFVVNDSSFQEFFKGNEWGVACFEDLSRSQMEQILYSSMLNNVYFTDMLDDAPGPQDGQTMRRVSALSVKNKLDHTTGENFPNSYHWNKIRGKDIILLQDNTPAPLLNFTYSYMIANSLKESDYALITQQDSTYVFDKRDVFVNGVRVAERNIKCKNGVIHRLEKLVTPLTNMAQIVTENQNTQQFSILLNRFSAPYKLDDATKDYGEGTDVYVKKYYTERGHDQGFKGNYLWGKNVSNIEFLTSPSDSVVTYGLKFDPGWNTLTSSDTKDMNVDMAAMFVPNDEALTDYWDHGGEFLKRKYGTWENVPDYVVLDLLNNHMKSSFVAAVPSKFDQVKNDAQIDMELDWAHVQDVMLGCNGVVYVTNKVYPPVSYIAVTAPTLVNDNMTVIDWATKEYGFLAYLHSMDSYYSFVLPTDEAFNNYLDPLSVAQGEPEIWKFRYNNVRNWMEVDVFDTLGVKKETIPGSWSYNEQGNKEYSDNYYIIQNRLEDLIDQHIIVDTTNRAKEFKKGIDDAYDGMRYFQTKGNGTIKVMPSKTGNMLELYGGYQLENESPITVSTVSDHSKEGNGKTYIVNTLMQSSLTSVYDAMKLQASDEDAPFYEFFNLMNDAGVFYKDKYYASLSEYTVDIFNTYHYTIYVPSNEAVKKAFEGGLPSLEQAEAYVDSIQHANPDSDFDSEAYLDSIRTILHDFVCYHIHDNSVYIGGGNVSGQSFQTGSLDMIENTFHRLTVNANSSSLIVQDGVGENHSVLIDSNEEGISYNVMTRDYLFDNEDITQAKNIETTSFAVLHAIDGSVLLYEEEQLQNYARQVQHLQQSLNKTTK